MSFSRWPLPCKAFRCSMSYNPFETHIRVELNTPGTGVALGSFFFKLDKIFGLKNYLDMNRYKKEKTRPGLDKIKSILIRLK